MPPAEEKPQPPAFEVVANVWVDWLWPFREVIAPERRPREDVATQVAVLPFVWRIIPFEPREEAESRSELIFKTPEVVAFVARRLVTVVVPVRVGLPENTTEPAVPVSSVRMLASSDEVSMSPEARNPSDDVANQRAPEPVERSTDDEAPAEFEAS